MTALEDVIIARKVQGRILFRQAILVATSLGQRKPKTHGAYHDFEENGLFISYDDYGGNIQVDFKDLRVLTVHLSEVKGFVPGIWEEQLFNLYLPLAVAQAGRDHAEEQKKQKNLLGKWGISKDEVSAE